MLKKCVFIALISVHFSVAAQNVISSPNEIENAFEAYKQCIKSEKRNENIKITKANYQALCQKEMVRLKGASQESYPAIQNIIEKWIGAMEQKG